MGGRRIPSGGSEHLHNKICTSRLAGDIENYGVQREKRLSKTWKQAFGMYEQKKTHATPRVECAQEYTHQVPITGPREDEHIQRQEGGLARAKGQAMNIASGKTV